MDKYLLILCFNGINIIGSGIFYIYTGFWTYNPELLIATIRKINFLYTQNLNSSNLQFKSTRTGTEDFEKLFKSHYAALCAFAYRYLKDQAQSEDIVQEVFYSLWCNFNLGQKITTIKSYLYSSVRNKCLNELKHNKVVENHIAEELKALESETGFHDHIIEEEVHRLIHEAVKELPEKCAGIMSLSIEGLNNNEIAEVLNISVNTVKTQKKIAYRLLRIKLRYLYMLSPLILQKFL